MAQQGRLFWTNLAVGILGMFIGIDHLFRWFNEGANIRSLIIGSICAICATGWLFFVLFVKRKADR